jgi:hypothetical protein
MTDEAQKVRAQFLVMAAVEAARDEGCSHVDIPALWGGTLCIYMGWDTYKGAVQSLWEAEAFKVEGQKIVIKRRAK